MFVISYSFELLKVTFTYVQHKVFIIEMWSIDTFTAGAIIVDHIATLDHEKALHLVEFGVFVVQRLASGCTSILASAKASEIVRCSRYNILPQLDYNSADCND